MHSFTSKRKMLKLVIVQYEFDIYDSIVSKLNISEVSPGPPPRHTSERQTPFEILSGGFEWRLNIMQTKTIVHLLTQFFLNQYDFCPCTPLRDFRVLRTLFGKITSLSCNILL
jgi:hypothetical protein